jgi:GNAT superfamily N-acetyltransferase
MLVEIKGEQYQLHQVTKDHVADFYELFESNRALNYSLNHFLKKFNKPPGDDFYYGFLLYKDNRAVAHTGAIPYYASIQGKTVKIANLTDTVTHKDFQRKGLNSFLIGHLIEFCKTKNVSFIYRLTKPITTFLSSTKYDFHQLGILKLVIIQVKGLPIVYRFLHFLGGQRLYHNYFKVLVFMLFNKSKMFESNESPAMLTIPRDEKYIAYKTDEKRFSVRHRKTCAILKIEQGVLIGDCSAKSTEEMNQFLRKIKTLCFLAGLKTIRFKISDNHPLFSQISKLGHVSDANPIMIKDIAGDKLYNHLFISASDVNTF